jgi:hypothetical protein
MPFKSKSRRKAYGKAWRKLNKAKQKTYNKTWKAKLKVWYSNYKSAAKCAICKESRDQVLESHHVHPENKTFCLFEGVKSGYSIRRLENEASKCIVVCNLHHRLHHTNALSSEEQKKWNEAIKLFEENHGTHDFGQPAKVISEKKKIKRIEPKTIKKIKPDFLLDPDQEYEDEPVLAVLQK